MNSFSKLRFWKKFRAEIVFCEFLESKIEFCNTWPKLVFGLVSLGPYERGQEYGQRFPKNICLKNLNFIQIWKTWKNPFFQIIKNRFHSGLSNPKKGSINYVPACISMYTCAMSGHANIFNNVVEYVPHRKSLDRSFYSWFQIFPIHNLKKISRISKFLSRVSFNNLEIRMHPYYKVF